ncbi:dipeptidyl aminopeptidase/acylaminoacyl peptidase [Chitinophaga niastensis]|uniref:Dipeptidyl aminopeptidase/acylaminoacyl peptidase n=1 Tax=Chitinophaga niastensis TaxID=536980 RepID=A0A2P8HJ51_CHINA|nr:S9 family peptidase [Chitinophaga niastensis]PSL46235.1 dipeptidyl aminopeptidase/acylaminoacyl peptidase [Chitinophaga niastensis]
MKYRKIVWLLALLSIPSWPLLAQQSKPTPYLPTHADILQRYRKVQLLDSITRKTVFKHNVDANWLPDGETCWYINYSKDSAKTYYLVHARTGLKEMVTDTAKIAQLIKNKLPANPVKAHGPSRWEGFAADSISPDKQWVATTIDGNVYIRKVADGSLTKFTSDGHEKHDYYGALAWSPDSKYLVGYRIHPVEDSAVYYVLTDVPGTTRGQLRSQPYKQPGDPFTSYEMYVFTLAGKTITKVKADLIDFFDAPVLHWRYNDPRYFLYEKVDRGHQRFRVMEVDAVNGNTRTVLDEQASTFIYEARLYTHYLPETNELLWTSEKDGWRHIYLVNTLTGQIKNQVTKGDWVVRDIDSIDTKKRTIWFRASGMHTSEDPYFIHYYRIGFDGSKLVELTPATGNHQVFFSPDRKYYVDKYSQVNIPPVNELHRTADGGLITVLEKADVSAWQATGVPFPVPFTAKGRDGKTDIWGVMCRPSDYDSTKLYPVIENIYAGPQDAFVPKSFMSYYIEMQSLADLGFVVVQIDGMGTANRSRAFHDVCWKNLADGGFADRILWIKALAQKYPFVDTARVGLYGTSAGGQNALGGLLFHPEFYKAAVASCGCHDNRVDKQWWNEQWMGYPVGKHYEEQSNVTNAGKLKGSLLLIVGEADNNVPPESTYRVINALIKSGKTFEFLPVPGMGHSDGGPYGRIKKRDFFVKQLLYATPPDRNINE